MLQDDLLIITRDYIPAIADDHGDSATAATALQSGALALVLQLQLIHSMQQAGPCIPVALLSAQLS